MIFFLPRRSHFPIAVVGVALSLLSVPTRAGDKQHFAWKEPLPGTAAVLGDDGGGADTVTVCDTVAKFKRWLDDTGDVPGCHSLPAGLPIVLGPITDDPEPTPRSSQPLVKVVIPSRHNYAGYTQLFGQVHPNIPKGTVVHYKREGNSTLRLAPSRDSDLDAGPDLGEAVTATVLQYDPTSDGMNLYVQINDGKFAGQKGWMLTLGAESEDGEPVDIFYESLIPPAERHNEQLSPPSSAGHEWLQANREIIEGAFGLLEGVRLCHLRSLEWSKHMEFRVGLYVGDNTTNDDTDEINGMISAAKLVADNAYAAGGNEFCKTAVLPRLSILEKKFQ